MRRWLLLIGGGLLVLFGALLFALRYVEVGAAETFWIGFSGLSLMSAAILAYYAESRILGVLIPGCILAGLAVGILLSHLLGVPGELFVLGGMGAGFLAIALVDRIAEGRQQTWAIIAGIALFALGIILAWIGSRESAQMAEVALGVLLLIVGAGVVTCQILRT